MIIGALSDGRKVLLACESGQRESKESWSRILRNLQRRGLKLGRLTVADGHLGIWSALAEQQPQGQEQRCWNHKSINVVDHLPKTEQPAARQLLHGMAFANSRAACERKRDQFVRRYEKNYPKAGETLLRDWDRMITFYDADTDRPVGKRGRHAVAITREGDKAGRRNTLGVLDKAIERRRHAHQMRVLIGPDLGDCTLGLLRVMDLVPETPASPLKPHVEPPRESRRPF